jgi:A/G-specific adenine glycosylase
MEIGDNRLHDIQEMLLQWYIENQRDLPWRRHSNAYYTLVSEIMLQQTKVATVIPYFERFIKRFPTVYDLADASDDDVVKLWEGLGYYSRARNLHAAIKEVVATYDGVIPNEKEKISKLKGIGPYTTGAVLSIAYKQKVPAVDGNVMRVFSRLFDMEDDIAKPATRKKMEAIAEQIIPDQSPGDFNQALMELGATVCTPKSPECLFCPIRNFCKGYQAGREHILPIKTKAKAPKKASVIMFGVKWNNKLLVQKRPSSGLLANMWALPTENRMEEMPYISQIEEYCETNQYSAKISEDVYRFEHIFSHRHWKIILISMELSENPVYLPKRSIWVDEQSILEFAFPKVYQKALEQLGYRN